MKYRVLTLLMAAGLVTAGLLEKQASALEIITMEDVKQHKIPVTALVKAADNGIMLFDTSASMNAKYKDTGLSRVQILADVLVERVKSFPALDINIILI